MRRLRNDGDEDVNRDGDPDLGLHGVLAGAVECQVLLVRPAPALIDPGDGVCREREEANKLLSRSSPVVLPPDPRETLKEVGQLFSGH
jgi:hypothetical protein